MDNSIMPSYDFLAWDLRKYIMEAKQEVLRCEYALEAISDPLFWKNTPAKDYIEHLVKQREGDLGMAKYKLKLQEVALEDHLNYKRNIEANSVVYKSPKKRNTTMKVSRAPKIETTVSGV